MQNDVLKNEIAPWQEKGRWYHAHLTETGFDSSYTDKFILDNMLISSNSGNAELNTNAHALIDCKYIINDAATAATRAVNVSILIFANGHTGCYIPRTDQYTKLDCDAYFFIK